jgi:hypothetical protein
MLQLITAASEEFSGDARLLANPESYRDVVDTLFETFPCSFDALSRALAGVCI